MHWLCTFRWTSHIFERRGAISIAPLRSFYSLQRRSLQGVTSGSHDMRRALYAVLWQHVTSRATSCQLRLPASSRPHLAQQVVLEGLHATGRRTAHCFLRRCQAVLGRGRCDHLQLLPAEHLPRLVELIITYAGSGSPCDLSSPFLGLYVNDYVLPSLACTIVFAPLCCVPGTQ